MTRLRIELEPTRRAANAYKALLRGDWTKATAEAAIRLLREQLVAAGFSLTFPWETQPNRTAAPRGRREVPAAEARKPRVIPVSAPEYLREYIERVNQPLLAPLPRKVPRAPDEWDDLERLSAQAGESLFLQAQAELAGDASLFRDLQSVLYSCCVHALLPTLKAGGFDAEHARLLNILWTHASIAWHGQPAHAFFLKSLVTDYLGQEESTAKLLWYSFQLTPGEDHDYMTKAHAYWSHLVAHGHRTEAEHFLLALLRSAPPQHQAEIAQMLQDTFAARLNAKPPSPAPRRRSRG